MVNKWEIYICDLNPVQGSEQRGTRPVLIVSNDAVNHALPIVTVLPFSSVQEGDKLYPTEVFLPADITALPKDSVVMIQQVRTISQSRLLEKAGSIDNDDYRLKILEALMEYFEC